MLLSVPQPKGLAVADVIDSAMTVMEPTPGAALAAKIGTEELAVELLARAESDGLSLVGPGGVLTELTKRVPEAALEAELTEHVGYEPYDPAGHDSGNSRNPPQDGPHRHRPGRARRARDRAGSFAPVIVPTRRRRLGGVDQLVAPFSHHHQPQRRISR